MAFDPRRRKTVVLVTFGLTLLAIILALIAPEEKTLGSYIKLIYVHAAVTWVGMLMFVTSGVLAMIGLARILISRSGEPESSKQSIVDWSSATQTTALHFWATSVMIGSVAAYLTWGRDWWVEPRLRVALFILILTFAVYQLGQMVSGRATRAALNFGLPVSAALLLYATGKLVHPNNAFANSDSFEIKLFAGLITLVFIVVAVTSALLFNDRLKVRSFKVEHTSHSEAGM